MMAQEHIDFSLEQGSAAYHHDDGHDVFHRTVPRRHSDSPDLESMLASVVMTDVVADLVERHRNRRTAGPRWRPRPVSIDRHRVETFVPLLLDHTSDRCEEFAAAMVDAAGDPSTVAETLLKPAAQGVDLLWRADTVDFLEVTTAVARMLRIFRRITAERQPPAISDPAGCALLAPVPGEQHVFGLAVVDDALRRAGWEVDCCGCGEQAALFRLAAANDYRIIGLSVSRTDLLPALESTIHRLRAKSRNASVSIIAGGDLFARNPELALAAGADLVAWDVASTLSGAASVRVAASPKDYISVAAE